MSKTFPRNMKNLPPTAVSAQGCYIYDKSGKPYLDGSGGAAVSCLGHGDPDIIAAIKAQTDQLSFAHTGFFTSEPAEKLSELLIKHAPGELDRVYLVSGGSESTEAAIKLARQFHIENGQPERKHLIARKQSYHGNTLGSLAAGGNEWRRKQFSPLLINVSHISPCYEYDLKEETETSYNYGQRMAQELEDEILRLGPETVMAFMAEPVVGATLGAVPAVDGYFKKIRKICNQYGVLLILDEVMCGMGRTGHLYACDAEQITPDILCIAKGLGAGYQPIGAMLCTSQIYECIETGSGLFQHGHTYLGHPIAAAAARAVVKKLVENDLVDRAAEKGKKLSELLESKFSQHPNVGDIRGRGLFRGIEFVENRETKKPFNSEYKFASRLKANAFEAGLICYPMSGTRDGKNGDHVLLAPPFIIDDAQLDELVKKLDTAITETLGQPA